MSDLLRYKPRQTTTQIILHDSHTIPEVSTVDNVPRWASMAHEGGLKMGLLSIGYHDIIERDGTIIECRHHSLVGSHTPGHNLDSIGICLVGGREVEGGEGVDNFTEDQKRSLLRRCHEYRTLYPSILKVVGHSEVQRFRRRDTPPCPPLDMELFREDLELYSQGIIL
ncbi:N-acetylmuramoyl-L-alanine amidase [Brucella intermedia]|uniref:N-acetylmuramoyl-L-alanine amidase n=1 Tax=Brucella intermedia TaxID=94625 RepID=UPI00396A76E1